MAINKEKTRLAAQKYLQKGQLDKAIREYERLVEDDPKDVRTLLKLGDLQTRNSENPAAVKTYAKVAQFYSDQGFLLKAVAVYKQITNLDPNHLEVNTKLAELYHQLGLLSDATKQYQRVSTLFEQQGRMAESVGVLKKMLELDPDNVASRFKLAELYVKENKNNEARVEFQKAATYLKAQHRVDDYVKVAERIVTLDPDDLTLTRELANIYIQKNDARRALAKLQICFKQNPKDVETLRLLANAFYDLGQTPKTLSVYRELARIHKDQGDLASQKSVLRKILELAPGDEEATAALGEDAKSTLARIVPAQKPVVARPEIAEPKPAAPVESSAADDDDAFEVDTDIEVDNEPAEASEPEPRNDDAADTIRRLLVETDVCIRYGLRTKAVEHLQKIFALEPNHREAATKFKDLLIEQGDTQGAATRLWAMAQAAHDAGESQLARDDLEELLGLDPQHEPARALLFEIAPEASALGPILGDASDDLSHDSDGASDVPAVHLEGGSAGHGLTLEYEPSREAAGIDLDEDDEAMLGGAEPLAHDTNDALLGGDESFGLEVETEVEAADEIAEVAAPEPVAPEPEAAEPEPEPAPVVVKAPPAPEPAKPVVAAKPAPPAPAAGARARTALDDDLDALLASAVPKKTAAPAAPAAAKPASQAPTQQAPIAPKVAPAPTPAPKVDVVASAPKPAPAPVVAKIAPAVADAPAESPADNEPVDLSDEVDEVRFFLQQGLEDEAHEALKNLLAAHPDHPEVLILKAELATPEPAPQAPAPAEPDAHVNDDARAASDAHAAVNDESEPEPETINLASDLAEELSEAPVDDSQVSFNDVFDQFKKGVEKQVDASDYETHYNLGIAYREMGLTDDAIREFTIAQQSPEREIVSLTMVGLCQLERGRTTEALDSFLKGLNAASVTAQEAVALRFEIGNAYESMGRGKDALKFYEKAQSMDPSFRDVSDRLARLRGEAGEAPEAEESATDELDALLQDTPAERAAQGGKGKISYL